MTNLEKIRKACIEASPEIVKKQKGCFFNGQGYSAGEILIMHENHPTLFCATIMRGNYQVDERVDFVKKDVKILGREIQLTDVLMAIGGKGLVSMKIVIAGDVSCASFIWDYGKPNQQNVVWNLKQPLSGQTPETILFLSQLLS